MTANVKYYKTRDRPLSRRSGPGSNDWRGKLVSRQYVEEARFSPLIEYSVRVMHAGESSYFPLGTRNAFVAAAKAKKIHQFVCQKGWAEAKRVFPREITVGFFWTGSPLTCTYASIYSVPAEVPERWQRQQPSKLKTCRVVVVESEDAVRKAIVFWVDRQHGFFCAGEYASISQALGAMHLDRADLLVANRALMERPGGAPLDWLRKQLPAVKVFGYGVYEESNYIFHSVTGVKSGYLLCRRPPARVFEPIQCLGSQPKMAYASLEREVLRCFQSLFASEKDGARETDFSNLTPRECEVLAALARGMTEKEVAATLKISTLTVHNHVKKIYAKLDAHSRAEVVVKYLGH